MSHSNYPKTNQTPLPTSPTIISPPSTPPSPPTPWSWTCHRCGHTYTLATTRRCLSCSHRSCVADTGTRSRALFCRSAFDYAGWREHNDWRRERAIFVADPTAWRRRAIRGVTTVGLSRAERRAARVDEERRRRETRDRARAKRMRDREHNCWIDCDYPSHCHNVRYEEEVRVMEGLLSSGSSSEDEADEAVTPPPTDPMDDVVVEKSCSDASETAPYESREESEWFDPVWTGWEDTASDSSDTSNEEVSEEERREELGELAKLARMNQ